MKIKAKITIFGFAFLSILFSSSVSWPMENYSRLKELYEMSELKKEKEEVLRELKLSESHDSGDSRSWNKQPRRPLSKNDNEDILTRRFLYGCRVDYRNNSFDNTPRVLGYLERNAECAGLIDANYSEKGGEPLLFQFIDRPDSPQLVDAFLRHYCVDVNKKNYEGDTPLHQAVLCANEHVAKLLLDAGVDVNAVDAQGCTALDLAALVGHKAMIELLCANNVNARNLSSPSPVSMIQARSASRASMRSNSPASVVSAEDVSLLHQAVLHDDEYVARSLLDDTGAGVGVGEFEYQDNARKDIRPESSLTSESREGYGSRSSSRSPASMRFGSPVPMIPPRSTSRASMRSNSPSDISLDDILLEESLESPRSDEGLLENLQKKNKNRASKGFLRSRRKKVKKAKFSARYKKVELA